MLPKTHHLASALCLAVLSVAANAQTIQPGLWESSSKITGGTGEAGKAMTQMQERLANMPPEQRKAMEQMMSPESRNAMMAQMQKQMANMPPEQRKAMEQAMNMSANMSMGGDGSTTLKMCITQEMIDRKVWMMGQAEGKCTHTVSPAVGNTQKFGFTCTEPPGNGEGSVTFLSKTSYTSSVKISAMSNGKPESLTVEGSNKFLGADCGSVKPLPVPQK
jgi:Protein of unknown function (DUF3617)